jgi:hypothetical protein
MPGLGNFVSASLESGLYVCGLLGSKKCSVCSSLEHAWAPEMSLITDMLPNRPDVLAEKVTMFALITRCFQLISFLARRLPASLLDLAVDYSTPMTSVMPPCPC